MDVSPNALRKDTAATLRQIEASIAVITREAEANGIAATSLRYMDGTWPMIPLLLAKSQCLATLTALNEQGKRK